MDEMFDYADKCIDFEVNEEMQILWESQKSIWLQKMQDNTDGISGNILFASSKIDFTPFVLFSL